MPTRVWRRLANCDKSNSVIGIIEEEDAPTLLGGPARLVMVVCSARMSFRLMCLVRCEINIVIM